MSSRSLPQVGVGDAEVPEHPGGEVLGDEVEARHQPAEQVDSLRRGEVEGDRSLAHVDRVEQRVQVPCSPWCAALGQHRGHLAGAGAAPAIQPAARFHLDDLRAEQGEQLGGVGAGPRLSQHQTAIAGQRPGGRCCGGRGRGGRGRCRSRPTEPEPGAGELAGSLGAVTGRRRAGQAPAGAAVPYGWPRLAGAVRGLIRCAEEFSGHELRVLLEVRHVQHRPGDDPPRGQGIEKVLPLPSEHRLLDPLRPLVLPFGA